MKIYYGISISFEYIMQLRGKRHFFLQNIINTNRHKLALRKSNFSKCLNMLFIFLKVIL